MAEFTSVLICSAICTSSKDTTEDPGAGTIASDMETCRALAAVLVIGLTAIPPQRRRERCPRLDALPGRDLPGGLRIAEAGTRAARVKGLARLDEMPATTALHLPKCRSIHTFTMRFALALIWLDKRGHVVRVDPNVPPRRMKHCLRARAVIEARAGTADGFLAAGLAGSQLKS